MAMQIANSSPALHVLIADDDPIFRSLAEARLLHLHCTFHLAGDGGQAWQVTRSQKLDLALVDFDMPGLDGIALTRCLRGHAQTRHIPIVMCTSRTDNAAMLAALEAGVSSFLTKPVNWSLFESHIRHLLALSEAMASSAGAVERLAETAARKDALVLRLLAALDPALQSQAHLSQWAALRAEVAAIGAAYAKLGNGVDQANVHSNDTLKRSA